VLVRDMSKLWGQMILRLGGGARIPEILLEGKRIAVFFSDIIPCV